MNLRIYYKQLGGHVHCRVFVGKAKGFTHAKSGDLVFGAEEWPIISDMLRSIAEVLPEED